LHLTKKPVKSILEGYTTPVLIGKETVETLNIDVD